MKAKNFTFLIASILALVLFANLVSATITFTNVTTLNQDETPSTITIRNDNIDVNPSVGLSMTPIDTITFSLTPTITEWEPVEGYIDLYEKEITITPNIPADFEFLLGEPYSYNLIVKDSDTNKVLKTQILSFEQTTYCEFSNNGNLKIEITDVNVRKGFGDEDDYWYPEDEIEIEVEISYDGSNSRDEVDVDLEWALYNKDRELIMDNEEGDFQIDDGDEETITFKFKLDADELDEDSEDKNYIFYVKAIGDEDRKDNPTRDICAQDSKSSIEIHIDRDFVILSNIELAETIQCDSTLYITADVWNIGDKDQEDVLVLVSIEGLNIETQNIEIGNIDTFEEENLEVSVAIPKDVEEGKYYVKLYVYDEDDDIYKNSEDEESKFSFPVMIQGGCIVEPQVIVSADSETAIQSGGKAGKELIFKAIVTNIGDESSTFTITTSGYSAWASSANIDQEIIYLPAGEPKEFLITLNTNKDSEGEQSFNIEVLSEGNIILSQPFLVTIEKSGFSFGGITGGVIGGNSWYLWGIGALNIILVIIIIIVAIRVARS